MDKFDKEYLIEVEIIRKQNVTKKFLNKLDELTLPKIKKKRMRGYIKKAIRKGKTVNLDYLVKFTRDEIMRMTSKL